MSDRVAECRTLAEGGDWLVAGRARAGNLPVGSPLPFCFTLQVLSERQCFINQQSASLGVALRYGVIGHDELSDFIQTLFDCLEDHEYR
jgi:hypothetical protein